MSYQSQKWAQIHQDPFFSKHINFMVALRNVFGVVDIFYIAGAMGYVNVNSNRLGIRANPKGGSKVDDWAGVMRALDKTFDRTARYSREYQLLTGIKNWLQGGRCSMGKFSIYYDQYIEAMDRLDLWDYKFDRNSMMSDEEISRSLAVSVQCRKQNPPASTSGCARCGSTQHYVRDCPTGGSCIRQKDGRVVQASGGGNVRCFVCNVNPKDGHNSDSCPYRHPLSQTPNLSCVKCRRSLAGASFCPRCGTENKKCWNCGSPSHKVNKCPQPRYMRKDVKRNIPREYK